MKITINITKWNLILIIGIVFVIAGTMVYAYNSAFNKTPVDAPVFGHSADELSVATKNSGGGIIATINMQVKLENMPGLSICKITNVDLSARGCPIGAYAYKVNTAGDSFCRFFFSQADNLASPPNCYDGYSGGGSDLCDCITAGRPLSVCNLDPCCVGTGWIRRYCA